jgi:hypothetical protein
LDVLDLGLQLSLLRTHGCRFHWKVWLERGPGNGRVKLLLSFLHATHMMLLRRHLVARAASSFAPLGVFSEEENMLKDAVKKWAEAEVKPHVRRMDAEKKMVREITHSERERVDRNGRTRKSSRDCSNRASWASKPKNAWAGPG